MSWLTRKQQWRRVAVSKKIRATITNIDTRPDESEIHDPIPELKYESVIEQSVEKNFEKRVRFVNEIRIILIPHRIDYVCDDLIPSLWYSKEELSLIKRSAVIELRTYMNLFNLDLKPAMINLYQSMSKTDSLLLIKNAKNPSKVKTRSNPKRRALIKIMKYQYMGSSSKLME